MVARAAGAADAARAPDAAALVTHHCLPCHSASGAAPIRFDSPAALQRNRLLMRELIDDRSMPPWLPSAASAPLRHDRRLSDADRTTLLTALASAESAATAFASITTVNEPLQKHASVAPEAAWVMPASGGMRIRSFNVPLPIDAPQRIRGAQFAAAATLSQSPLRIVALAADPSGSTRILSDPGESGYESMGDVGLIPSGALGALTRVAPRFELPDGFAFELPHGDLVLETTSEAIGRAAEVLPHLSLLAARESDTRTVHARALRIVPLALNADEAKTFEVSCALERDCDILGVVAKGGAFLRALEVTHHDNTGCTTPILRIDDFRLSLCEPWLLATPMHAEAGSTIHARFGFDNTAANPLQPARPSKRVTGGLPPDGEDATVVILFSPR